MTKCLQCYQFYYAHDSDAGTYKESFCSEECELEYERELENHIASYSNQSTENLLALTII